jgi:hypothetical protein
MKRHAKLLAAALALSVLPLLYACDDNITDPDERPVIVSPAYAKLYVGQMVQLSATLNGPATEASMNGHKVLWSSSDPFVARVSEDGWVQGLKAGHVTITGGCGQYCGTARVVVSADTPGEEDIPPGGEQ